MNDTTTDDELRGLLTQCRTLAVVGLSPQAERPSHKASSYMQQHGYRIIPVNPVVAREGGQILGEPAYASVTEAAAALAAQGTKIDMVDCFRKSQDIPPIADEAIAIGAHCLWLQQEIFNEAAVQKARAAGLVAVEDRCVKIEHQRLLCS
ncbi:CoA-binding protein [Comamonas composti]|uniref:CoA-binding protein n=1 Tax=Comamonas composti TaxID=408558 RepID=UPI0003F92C92|nr:CoA-binding protein [Comamonas composti]